MILNPFDFQLKLRDYFKQQTRIWNFFSSFAVKDEESTNFKTEILKNCYRLSKDLHPKYHILIEDIKAKFNLKINVELYQEQNNSQTNANLFLVQNEAHIILTGSVLEKLELSEIKVVLAHELAHVFLYKIENSEFQTTERIIHAITDDMRSPAAYFETARLFSLYTELFCDYGSFIACGDRNLVISTLVKIHTGLDKVFAEEYLEQINEIFEKENHRTEQSTHPEMYFRAKSLELLCKDYENGRTEIEPYISGSPPLQELDIFQQKKWQETTLKFIQLMLSPLFMRSPITSAHAKAYQNKFLHKVLMEKEKNALAKTIQRSSKSIQDYLCYTLLDFTLIDRDIYEPALIWNLQISEFCGLKEGFERIVKKEMNLSELKFKDLYKRCLSTYQCLPENQLSDIEKKISYSIKKGGQE